MGSPMTGPISEAATGPRESAAAAPAKEGLHPGLGNPGAGLLVDEGPRAGTPVPDPRATPLSSSPITRRRNRRRSHARPANLTRKADGYDTRDRWKRHSIRHTWLPTDSRSHLLQRLFPSPHPFTGPSSSEGFLDGLPAGKLRENCRRIRGFLPFRTRKALASHSCECARTGIGHRTEGGSRCVRISDGSLVGPDRVRDGLGRVGPASAGGAFVAGGAVWRTGCHVARLQ